MATARKRIGEILLDMGATDASRVQAAVIAQRQRGGRVGQLLVEAGDISESQLVDALAKQLDIPAVHLQGTPPQPAALALVPKDLARRFHVVPLQVIREGGKEFLTVATGDPTNTEMLATLETRTKRSIRPILAGERDIARAIEEHYTSATPAPARPPPPAMVPPPNMGRPVGGRSLSSATLRPAVLGAPMVDPPPGAGHQPLFGSPSTLPGGLPGADNRPTVNMASDGSLPPLAENRSTLNMALEQPTAVMDAPPDLDLGSAPPDDSDPNVFASRSDLSAPPSTEPGVDAATVLAPRPPDFAARTPTPAATAAAWAPSPSPAPVAPAPAATPAVAAPPAPAPVASSLAALGSVMASLPTDASALKPQLMMLIQQELIDDELVQVFVARGIFTEAEVAELRGGGPPRRG